MKRVVLFCTILIMLLMLICCFGCSNEESKPVQGADMRTVIDSTGTKLSIAKKPQRVVSVSLSTDEIVLDLLTPERIVGLSSLADDPSISNSVEKAKRVSNRVHTASPEGLLKLQPDLVIVPDFVKAEIVTTLRDLGLMVYVYETQKDINDVRKIIQDIGTLVGEEEKAKKLIANLDTRLSVVKKRLKQIPADKQKRIVMLHDYGTYYMPKSSFHDICRHARAMDATLDLRYDKTGNVSKEQVVLLNPDVFIIIDFNYDGRHDAQNLKNDVLRDKSYAETNAVKNKEVYVLSGKHMLGLSHHIADAVEDLAHVLYPECFKE